MLIGQRKGQWFEFSIPERWDNLSIEDILREKWQAPKGLVHQLRMEKAVKANAHMIPWNQPLTYGTRIQIQMFIEEPFGLIPDYFPLEPLFEDDHMIIVNKPAGMDTHPTQEGQRGTLANAIAAYWEMNGVFTKVRHVHRLDRDTSGAIIFAKHALAGTILDRLLRERKIKRTYHAIIQGVPKRTKGTINAPIGRDRHHATRRRVSSTGDQAITKYEIKEVFQNGLCSLAEIQLATGKTHQIRVHMSHLGHPLLGDKLYGGGTKWIKRQALHSTRIQVPHPILEELIEVEAPLPTDIRLLLEKLK